MSKPQPRRAFEGAGSAIAPGDVFVWFMPGLGKFKFHVCLSYDHDFAFVNSPKDKKFKHDFPIRADDIRFIKPTPEELSFVSCSIIKVDAATFGSRKPRLVGNLASDVAARLLSHFCQSPTIEIEDVERLEEVAHLLAVTLGTTTSSPTQAKPSEWPPAGTRPLTGRPKPTGTGNPDARL